MSNFKKCLTSILLVIALLFSTVCYASAENNTELMRYFKSHDITDYYKETVDGSWYYYVVNDKFDKKLGEENHYLFVFYTE